MATSMRMPALVLLIAGAALLAGVATPVAGQGSGAHCYKGYCYQTDVSNIYALLGHHCAMAFNAIGPAEAGADVRVADAIFRNGIPGNPSASYRDRVINSRPNRLLHRMVYPGYFGNYTVNSTTTFWSTTGRFAEALTFNLPFRQHRTLHTLIWDLQAKMFFDFLDDAVVNPQNALRNIDRARALYAGNPDHALAGCLDALDNVTDNTAWMMDLTIQTNDTQWSTFGQIGLRSSSSFDMTAYFNQLQAAALRGSSRGIRNGVLNIVTSYIRFGLMFIARNSYTIDYMLNCNNTISAHGVDVATIARQSMKDIGTLTLSLAQGMGVDRTDLNALRDAIWVHRNTTLPGGGPAYERVWTAVLRVGQFFGFNARHIGRPNPVVINIVWEANTCQNPPVTVLF